MKRIIVLLAAMVMVFGFAVQSHADLVTFNLNNVTFGDGGSALGSVTVDTNSDVINNLNIIVSDPTQGQVSFNNNGSNRLYVLPQNEVEYVLLSPQTTTYGFYGLQFLVDGSSGVMGGNIITATNPNDPNYPNVKASDGSFLLVGFFINGVNPANNNLAFYTIENSGGSLVEASQTSATPIPAAAYLFGSGLLGLVSIRKKMQK